ncbi:MAG: cysteine-rich CWC family protein [Bacteroidota bacterium]
MTTNTRMEQKNNSVCPQCGVGFECGSKAGKETCWCFTLPPVIPNNDDRQCLCPDCLKDRIHSMQKHR